MSSADGAQQQHPHRNRKSGRKAEKKRESKLKKKGLEKDNLRNQNPKAFTSFSSVKAARRARRNFDQQEKRQHVPVVDRTPDEPPPIVVAVVGPPGVGKSTLVRSLVHHYTKQNLSEIKGPITVVSGKARRLTLFECPNNLNAMIDVAKIADLVLLLVDAHFGFEMETFEFLNILQVHGFPRVMGVLTHLDQFKSIKTLRRIKKQMKHRFWTEIYQGAKLFYLSGLVGSTNNKKYAKREVHNLARFISVMKFRPLIWRNTHPYVLVDRLEDLTEPQLKQDNAKCDRVVTLYGYVRGTNLKSNMKVHIPGCGDHYMQEVEVLTDPCPPPGSKQQEKKKRTLSDKDKLLYAPMSDVGNILYDKDVVYINLPSNQVNYSDIPGAAPTQGPGEEMVRKLQEISVSIDERLQQSSVRLFSGAQPVTASKIEEGEGEEQNESATTTRRRRMMSFDDDAEEKDDEDDEDDEEDEDEEDEENEENGVEEDEDDEDEEDDDQDEDEDEDEDEDQDEDDMDDGDYANANAKDIAQRWENLFNLHRRNVNLAELIYGKSSSRKGQQDDGGDDDEDDDEFFKVKKKSGEDDHSAAGEENVDELDSCKLQETATVVHKDWKADEELSELIARCFAISYESDEEGGEGEENGVDDSDDVDSDVDGSGKRKKHAESEQEKRRAEKAKLKEAFDVEYDNAAAGAQQPEAELTFGEELKQQLDQQVKLSRQEFEDEDPITRSQYEGFRAGLYVRIKVSGVPYEMVEFFNPVNPVLVGGLLTTEESLGFIQARVKKHRWHKKILKTNDPVIFSVGWRRFQSLPLYAIQDPNGRNRMLKYTPLHMHCVATFYGPITAPNTGLIGFQSLSNDLPSFRVSLTGVLLEINQSFEVVKKLKLTGTPYKVHKNTAFVKGMFNSALEVSKFEGASIRTVSGIRGQVKKPCSAPEGAFRATFEDKVLMSDIIFLRTWYPVKPIAYYNPVCSMLTDGQSEWTGMKTVAQVRKEKGLSIPQKTDSHYEAIERQKRVFNTLKIPKSLQAQLPFASKPKQLNKRSKPTYETKRKVILQPQERRVVTLMQQLNTLKNEQRQQKKEKQKQRFLEHRKKKAVEDEKRQQREREAKKRKFRKESKEQARKEAAAKRQKRGGDE